MNAVTTNSGHYQRMPDKSQTVLSVSQLTAQIKGVLEEIFVSVWVGGEVSNLSRPRSGHIYFTLKDEGAQIPAVIWLSSAERMKVELRDGMEVVCRGKLQSIRRTENTS